MKKTIFMMMVVCGSLLSVSAKAQVHVSINIGNQPAWAPEGFDEAQYYYLPDIDIYYDVPRHQFVYLQNRRWVRSSTLPAAYRRYDLYKLHKVAINERNAYLHHADHVRAYAQYKGKYDQTPIRDSRDNRYTDNKNNWKNNRFQNNGNRSNGNGRGYAKGHH